MKRSVSVFSPAKVNLHLRIGARRPDGFHDACSIMQALTLHDTVSVTVDDGVDDFARPAGFDRFEVEATCATHGGAPALDIPSESNIAHRAAVALAHALGRDTGAGAASGADSAPREHVLIHIEKHIPHEAGLGGGSSNAAAVLAGLCRIWGVDAASPQVIAVAQSLGADVAFFLHGGCARLGERGDTFQASLAPLRGTVVVVKVPGGVSTKAAYAAFDGLAAEGASTSAAGTSAARAADGRGDLAGERAFAAPASLAGEAAARNEAAVDAAGLSLFNNLAPASELVLPQLSEVRAWLGGLPGVARDARTGEPRVLLSGSGSATFAILDAPDILRAATDIVAEARTRGWWARSCSFSPIGARVIEGAAPAYAPARSATNLGAAKRVW